jgi:hypothetical protein
LTGSLLAVLLLRAYIPIGFMPAAGLPFQLELCPAASPAMPMPAHHDHGHGDSHSHFDHCPFGSAGAAAPVSDLLVFASQGPIAAEAAIAPDSRPAGQRLRRAHQSRGPPALS